jgi:hypothetical protein
MNTMKTADDAKASQNTLINPFLSGRTLEDAPMQKKMH